MEDTAANGSKTLEDLFLTTLRDIYDAEKQVLKALPKMADAAASDELREVFEQHASETTGQVSRLEQIFALIGQAARAKRCAAIRAIIGEGNEAISEFGGSQDGDVALAASAQAVEHYEIARYGALKNWAVQLGHDAAAQLLDATLQEETSTDRTLDALRQRLVGEMTGQRPEAETTQNRQASRSLRAGGAINEDREMPRDSNNRERDDQGRFVSDDDNRMHSRGRSGDDNRSSGRGRSDDEYRSRSRDDDRSRGGSRDDDRGGSSRSGGRSQGGWFGDSEGHSEAARRGWESREDDNRSSSRGRNDDDYRSRGSSRDDDDRSYRARSGSDDRGPSRDEDGRFTSGRAHNDDDRSYRGRSGSDDRGPSRDEDGRFTSGRSRNDDDRFSRGGARDNDDRGGRRSGGWFGDSEGHSEAARRGWENPDHGDSGWFGDSQGHSDASRRGWRNSDHRESGWFGDPQGHSEASRRGWENRDDNRDGGRSSRDDEGGTRSGGNYGRASRDEDDYRSGRSRSR